MVDLVIVWFYVWVLWFAFLWDFGSVLFGGLVPDVARCCLRCGGFGLLADCMGLVRFGLTDGFACLVWLFWFALFLGLACRWVCLDGGFAW